ncbi:zinc finger protein 287-like isoform X2 [Zootermopsis nevadensis]|uniref:zinc finger protein 287-like isoform X2 n=1 Tax=Zootermopsis nevadensis TaxID=136037 RepID=UPI000B8EAC96|nr:zinc finger protein 287-like isoform X2 [Zootermopsis nevadensis]
MGTLVCPLCCDEEFSNQLSLRYHLLSITDNVYCPECSQRFDSILQLADHLDGTCRKGNFRNNDEECTADSDINTEDRIEEEMMIIHESETPQTEVVTVLNNAENIKSVFHEEVVEQVIAVAADTQLDGSESVYLVSDVGVEETAVTGIESECADITEQKVDVAVDHDNSTVAVEESYASGNYEITVRSTVTAEEDLPVKLCDLEKSEFVGESSQECGEAVHSLSTAGEMLRGSSESETVLPDVQDPADGQLGCGIYACSSCGITFSSVIEHIRMYHGGQEVVIEVPEVKKSALEKLIGASKEVLGTSAEQVIDMKVLPGSNDTSETAELQETTDATNFMSGFSEIYPENQMATLDCAAVNSETHENTKPCSWFKERNRVVADEEKIKQIVPDPKRVGAPAHTTEKHLTNELKYVGKEVKIDKFWETKQDEEMNSENASTGNKVKVSASSLPARLKKENRRLVLKRDTRTSIEKLFSGNFLLKGTGGRGTRPGPYLGVNRVPEVKVIMSPGDKGTENAISVFTCSTCQKEFGNVSAFERHSCTVAKGCTMVCKMCDMDISDMKAMRVHMESVHNIKTEVLSMAKRKYKVQMLPKPVKCESCDMTFTTLRALKLHSKMHERTELKVPLECPVCHNMCSSNRTLKQHMKVHTKPLPARRSEDDAEAGEEDAIVKAEKGGTHGLLVCKVCYKSFGNNEDLRVHWQEHLVNEEDEEEEKEENQEEQMDVVLKEVAVPEEEGVQTKKNTVPCVKCHKEIEKSCKEEHMAKHFSLLRYDCQICNKTFSKHGHLNMHMRIHRGFKEYSCIHCDKIFANMNLLRTHVQSHMVERPYQCGFCGRGFFRPHDKVEHERIHTGEKPYSCSMCGMRFRVRYCLTLHMRRHTGVRPYSCKMCGKTFRTGTAFKAHTKIHLDERAYN